MSKTVQKSAAAAQSHSQDTDKSHKTPASASPDQAKKPATKPGKSATDKQASSAKGHQ